MDILTETLDAKLKTWNSATAAEVRVRVSEIMDLADEDVLDLLRSRMAEQDVLDLLDEP